MTDRVALLMDLADRVEKADGADRELDVAIHQFLERPVLWAVDDDGCEYQALVSVPLYTASLDAALSLVPEGWKWSCDFTQRPLFQDCGRADLYAPGIGDDRPADVTDIYAATPALALCAASLRALAQEAPSDER